MLDCLCGIKDYTIKQRQERKTYGRRWDLRLNVHRRAVVVFCDQRLVEVGGVDHGADLRRCKVVKQALGMVRQRPERVRGDAGGTGEGRKRDLLERIAD